MPDQQVRNDPPVLARDDPLEVALDLDRVVLPRQAEPLREPADVRVDDDPLRLAELGGDDVGRLARDAGKARGARPAGAALAPAKSSSRIFIVPRIDFVFWRKKPVWVDVPFELLDWGTPR